MLEETRLAYELHRSTSWRTKATTRPFSHSTPTAGFPQSTTLPTRRDKFISTDPNTRYETMQWVIWQMGGVGLMFGQVGFLQQIRRQSL